MVPARYLVPAEAGLIALDWGTSALRAFRMGAHGEVLETRHRPWGIMNLPPATASVADGEPSAAFERALQDTCGDWLAATPGLPLLACGMVGSAQGWREAKYLPTPPSLDALARGLTLVERRNGPPLHIAPGLLQQGALPNVMRGEETQVLGVLAGLALPADAPVLIGLPGTHSKWVLARRGRIEQFHTFMTGALAPTAQADYLSGLLIGHEVASLSRAQDQTPTTPPTLVLCGEPDLFRRYAVALQTHGFAAPTIATQATATGLWQIALAAGLVVAPAPSPSHPFTAGSLAA